MKRIEIAREYFLKGYNCCQSVVVSFKEDLPFTEQFLLNLAGPFGAGVGRTRNICGAVSGMGIIIGLFSKNDSTDIKQEKDNTYILMQNLMAQFQSQNNTLICKELLEGVENATLTPVSADRTAEYYKERPCLKFVEDGVKIVEKYLIDSGIINE